MASKTDIFRNASVGYNGNYQIDTYIQGYTDAVFFLIEAIKNSKATIDTIIYPLVYCSRHCCELYLKFLIDKLIYINETVKPDFAHQFRAIHDLSILWKELLELSKIDSRLLVICDSISEYILDFAQVDDNGQAFRYPYSLDGTKHLSGISCINLTNFYTRFLELNNHFNNMDLLTSRLVEEYQQKIYIAGKSRFEIKQIAKDLPNIKNWNNSNFRDVKDHIKSKYALSSNQLSKIINLIKTHREFSLIIGKELPLVELTPGDFSWFIENYNSFIHERDNGNDYVKISNKYLAKIKQRLNLKTITSIAIIYDIGFFDLYPEVYDRDFDFMKKKRKEILIRHYLIGNGIVKSTLKVGLSIMCQPTLLEVLALYDCKTTKPL